MFEIMEKGGVLMYPILALSVISLAIFLERLVGLRKEKYVPTVFVKQVRLLLKRREYDEAQTLCDEDESALSRVVKESIINRNEGWQQLQSITEAAGRREAERLSIPQDALSMIAGISPLMGLLGTVFGMISLFNVLSGGGVGDPQALSGGIAVALLTTAAGLSVAIPAMIFFYIVKLRSDVVIAALETHSSELLNMIAPDSPNV